MHWSGCPAGCGNHTGADIGLLGKNVKIGDEIVDAVDVFVGGQSGPNAKAGTQDPRGRAVQRPAARARAGDSLRQQQARRQKPQEGCDRRCPCQGVTAFAEFAWRFSKREWGRSSQSSSDVMAVSCGRQRRSAKRPWIVQPSSLISSSVFAGQHAACISSSRAPARPRCSKRRTGKVNCRSSSNQ